MEAPKDLLPPHETSLSFRRIFPGHRASILTASIAALLSFAVLEGSASAVDTFIWQTTLGTPGAAKSWNNVVDWQGTNPNRVPDTNAEIAEFGAANATNINFGASTTVGGLLFDSTAPAFTISNRMANTSGTVFTIDGSVTGAGITNNSANTQTINNNGTGIGGFASSTLSLTNAVVQGTGGLTINNNGLGSAATFTNTSIIGPGLLTINDTLGSTTFTAVLINGAANVVIKNSAGGATFNNSSIGGAANLEVDNSILLATTTFNNTTIATTGSVVINNTGAASKTVFKGSSNAGNAVITNSGVVSATQFQGTASAGSAAISNATASSNTAFSDSATAGNATIVNNANLTTITFSGNSDAGNATLTNAAAVSSITFSGSATADNATITNNANLTTTVFSGSSSGGNAALINNGANTSIDISSLTTSGTTAGSISGDGHLFLGAKNLAVGGANTSTVFTGIVSDGGGRVSGTGGSLTKVGTGTLQLTGANTYTGGTNFNGGVLAVNQDGNLGTGALSFNGGTLETLVAGGGITSSKAITLNAGGGTFLADAGTTSVLSGVITGGGDFTKSGMGALEFAGSVANTYTGATFVNSGLLELNASGGAVAIPGALVIGNNTGAPNNAEVRLLQSSQIAGASPVTVNSDGLFNVNGQSASIGVLTVNSGNVSIGAGSLGVASLNQTGGAITGTGSLVLNGDVTAGTDAGGNPALISSAINLHGAARAFTVNGGSGIIGLDVSGVIGNGSLTKNGSGAMELDGVNTYTGATTVNAGALFVDGSIASADTFVQPGGLIGGHGTIGGNLINSGVVSPGNSPGTLTVSGNFTQSSSGTLLIQVGGLSISQHDLLSIGGNATLGGTLQIQQLNNFHFELGNKVTFLSVGGIVSGTFGTIINPFNTGTLIGAEIIYEGNGVALEGVQLPFTSIPEETPNQRAVAHALDEAGLDSRTANLVNHLDHESLGHVLADLDRIAPDELTSIYQIGVSQARVQTDNLQRRLEDVRSGSSGFSTARFSMTGNLPGAAGPQGDAGFLSGPDGKSGKEVINGKTALTPTPENRWGIFVTGSGEWASVGDTSNSRGYDLTNAGFTIGVDFKATPNLIIGLATGYARSDAYLTEGGRVTVDGAKLALYTSYFTGGFYADAALQGGYNSYGTSRSALEGTARGSTDGGEFSALFGTGYDWKKGALTFGPTATFDYTYLGLGSFTERGSLVPLDFPNQHQESIRSTIGAKATYDWKVGGVLIRPEIRAGWQHEYGDATFGIESQFASGAGPEFLVHGPATGRDSLVLSLGFAIVWNERTSTYVYYDGELGRENYQASSISGGIRVEF